jgi:hypothetical protein
MVVGEQVGLGNGAGDDQGIMAGERVLQGSESNALRVLGGGHEQREWVGREAKLWEKRNNSP